MVDFFYEVFLKDEPSGCGKVRIRVPARVKQLEDLIRDGVSLMVLDMNNQNKMVGIRTASTIKR